jgi:hypothetical protein
MARRIATTERCLMGELLVRAGRNACRLASPSVNPCARSASHHRRLDRDLRPCARRRSSLLTPLGCHLPPRAAGIFRAFNSCARALSDTRPFTWNSRIVEASALAWASAAFLFAIPLLTLPLVFRPARQQPSEGVAMPATAKSGWYPPSVQFTRQRLLGNEACRHKLPNGRVHGGSAGVCGPLVL